MAKTKYAILSEKDIRQKQDEAMAKIAALLSVPNSDAGILLRHFKWNVPKVIEQWFENEESVRCSVGLLRHSRPEFQRRTNSRRPSLGLQEEIQCGICLDTYRSYVDSNKMIASLPCGHFFCDTCWRSYIHTAIKDGPGCLKLRCADPSCGSAIGEDMVFSLITCADDRRKYSRYLLRSYVEGNCKVKWCPAPGCEYAVRILELEKTGDILCKCSFKFCWSCLEESHRPVDCKTVGKWMMELESQNTNWILANSKPCPQCNRPIEKNKGCHHMTCSAPCQFQFCWLCLGKWEIHFRCNQYDGAGRNPDLESNEADRKRDMAKSPLDRYAHYYERWANNEKSRAKALADLQMQAVQIGKLSDKLSQPVSQFEFVIQAWSQIVESRRILQWTYAYGYYLPEQDRSKRHFFEFLQGEAEATLESLHTCAEKDLLVFLECDSSAALHEFRSKCKFTRLTCVTRRYFENLVRALESGLTDVFQGDVGRVREAVDSEDEEDEEA